MSAQLLTGTDASNKILEGLQESLQLLHPHLVILQVGDDAASETYIRKKMESCKKIGLQCTHDHLPEHISLDDLLSKIHALNEDKDVSGYILQLPLPDRKSTRLNSSH